jgi:hypothetical protein
VTPVLDPKSDPASKTIRQFFRFRKQDVFHRRS